MGAFDTLNAAVGAWNDRVMGTPFTYGGSTLAGVFNQPSAEFSFDETGQRRTIDMVCVTQKAQWVAAGLTPANRGQLVTDGITYTIDAIDGLTATGEPCFTLYLRVLT